MKYKICKRKRNEAECINTNNTFKYLYVKIKILLGLVKEWK